MKKFNVEFKKNSISKITKVQIYALDKDSAKYEIQKYMDRVMKGNMIWLKVEEIK